MLKNSRRIRPKKRKRKPEKFMPWIARIFNYQCYVTFLTGYYSCQWKFRQQEKTKLGSCCCSWREQLFCPCLAVSFVFSLILLYVWIETANEYFNFDWATFLGTGYWFFWSVFILSLAGTLTVYSALLLLFGFLLLWEGIELYLHWCHKILILLVILLCSIFLFILCKFWKERWLVAGLSLQIFAPYVHLSCITVMVSLSWPVTFYVIQLEREIRRRRYRMKHSEKKRLKKCNILTKLRGLQVAVGLPFLLILLCFLLMPLGIYSPCIQEEEDLGPKPVFIGHRGAPMSGPENTMMSFEKAVEQGAYALESDVHFSYDRVPFLMHDFDLRRTTNIREVRPEAAFRHSSSFSWDFLSTLNAGKWFTKPELRPFFNMKPLSKADRERARNQSIPKLADLLTLAKKENKFVIFDINGPPPKHPIRHTFIRYVISVILASKIEQRLIFWLPSHDINYVRNMAPGVQHVARFISVEELAKQNISRINVDYKRLFLGGLRAYKAANININLYVVNEPWLYSLAWCSRINSVTTDNIPRLSQLDHPYFFMTPRFYMFIWLFVDTVSAIIIVAIFCFHWRREIRKEKGFDNSSILTAASKKSAPLKNTVRSLNPAKHDIQAPASTKIFALSQAPTRKAILPSTLPNLKVDKPTMPPVEGPDPETRNQLEIPPMALSSQESYATVYSTVSNMPSSYQKYSKK
ncbi:glycerophosphodiester phosphodiesterase domain-containing protein 4 [Carlito syrichta]|uniref:Glycerophosphodiester phosphodiesterase domain-containing protein 4 n=1 Tax=Carlito syrichta TaxID=1868482 RepID=A0A3Q0E8X1_CARSF|nr:glycerophosphodiester phosphodiesterase domain-containing protein 4 [Carlito syrichta]